MCMDQKYSTLDNPEYFEKIVTESGVGYRVKNYPGPISMDATAHQSYKKTLEYPNNVDKS